ncbi:uncharacterized protein LOC110233990 [Exaiptasia diaphana]|uniref:TNFR-Cys domain-containing protein n=1 Tax=Exaiptasia diaphana TaxID=2652724 RepID=A0A913WW39_EXADI|nr:uncharacterized protein LOC110233990 [Exaiptasia diaphana]KXJ17429.1 hypothetical protein AC249_AIPGENE4740 [Exaiptasia diaphana]
MLHVNNLSRSLWLLGLTVIFTVLESTARGCTVNQYKRVSGGKVTCIDCPLCPAGYGLRYQCGTTLPDHGKIKCDPCIKGVNYSIEYNHEQCKPCSAYCSDDQVTTCTTDSKPICQPQCKSKENYYQNSSNDCQKCSRCCGDRNDVVENECIKKGMPLEQRCSIHRKKKCTPTLGTGTPNVTQTNSSVSTTSTIVYSSTTQKPIGPTDSKNKKEDSEGNTILYVGIGLLVVVSVLIMVVICFMRNPCMRWYNCRFKRDGEDQRVCFVNLPNHLVNGADTPIFDWFKKGDIRRVKEKICTMLDTQKSFAKVARQFNMDEDEIKLLIERPGNHPTEVVLEYVECSYDPNLTVSDFIKCTDAIHRKDVSKVLKRALYDYTNTTSQAPTPQDSLSQATTSQAATSQASTLQATTSQAATSQDNPSQAIALQVATSQV